MKWNFFKKGKSRGRTHWFATAGQRVTGVVTDIPNGIRVPLMIMSSVVVLALSMWGMWALLNAYYFRSSLFVLNDLRDDVTITTGKTLTPDLVCEFLGLKKGINLQSVKIDRKRRELLEKAPNIRDVKIERSLPNKLSITITEREPIARVGMGPNGRVIDGEGVVFVRYPGTGGLPLVKGAAEFAELKPGERLCENGLAAIRLIDNTLRPDCKLRLYAVDTAKPDYLMLTFSDYRQAKFAWEGMSDEQKDTREAMQRQLDNLANAMNNEIGRGFRMWDATLPRPVALH